MFKYKRFKTWKHVDQYNISYPKLHCSLERNLYIIEFSTKFLVVRRNTTFIKLFLKIAELSLVYALWK